MKYYILLIYLLAFFPRYGGKYSSKRFTVGSLAVSLFSSAKTGNHD